MRRGDARCRPAGQNTRMPNRQGLYRATGVPAPSVRAPMLPAPKCPPRRGRPAARGPRTMRVQGASCRIVLDARFTFCQHSNIARLWYHIWVLFKRKHLSLLCAPRCCCLCRDLVSPGVQLSEPCGREGN